MRNIIVVSCTLPIVTFYMQYKSSLDNTAKAITTATITLFIFILFQNFFLPKPPVIISIITVVLFIIILVIPYIYAPSGYLVENGMLIIVRPVNKIEIPISDIKDVRLLNKDELGTLIRMGGSGGLFGYFGNFRSTRLGRLKLYTTRRNNRILITTIDDERLIITPDDTSIIQFISPRK